MEKLQAQCEICQRAAGPGHPLVGLNELGLEHAGNPEAFFLCQDCLGQREIASWPLGGRNGEKVFEALERHADVLHPKFTYLSDAKRIRLVRLRPQWVHERLAS